MAHQERSLPFYTSSEEAENAIKKAGRYMNWLALRLARPILATGLLVSVLFFISSFLDRPTKFRTLKAIPTSMSSTSTHAAVTWSDYAYVQYVTDDNYLCNSLMILEALHRYRSKADRILMYSEEWKVPEQNQRSGNISVEGQSLAKERDLYAAKLVPIKLQSFERAGGDQTRKDSYKKLLAFNQTPLSPVAMPHAYWLDDFFLCSAVLLVEPSQREWRRIEAVLQREDSGFDMEVLNTLYKDQCMVLPHCPYILLTGDLRGKNHTRYLGSDETWNATEISREVKYVHFSDAPMPKPWLRVADNYMAAHRPEWIDVGGGREMDCADRDGWSGLYQKRQSIRGRV
ncbi:hypothetical protein CC86DRAFT_437798 [Ophiobolus disseminans]|uniref:Nucleotide-diphospho-sugar transferase n=1 Tax=Ophiobolus disseminans TaxID=1469910 RepID=A0A6A7A5B8_9PLEO|nr:hypothetical protein CC86DRAFT_437798 [Ophiobolus disseminans]